MNTNIAAASYHPRILSPKYGQTGNVKPLTANRRSLSFAVKWPNLDLKVSIVMNEDFRALKDALENLKIRKNTSKRVLPGILSKIWETC